MKAAQCDGGCGAGVVVLTAGGTRSAFSALSSARFSSFRPGVLSALALAPSPSPVCRCVWFLSLILRQCMYLHRWSIWKHGICIFCFFTASTSFKLSGSWRWKTLEKSDENLGPLTISIH